MGNPAGAHLCLPESCSGENAPTLISEILAQQGSELVIDASAVKTIDTPSVEVLIAAGQLWAGDDMALQIENPSEDFIQGLATLGLDRNDIEIARSNHGH